MIFDLEDNISSVGLLLKLTDQSSGRSNTSTATTRKLRSDVIYIAFNHKGSGIRGLEGSDSLTGGDRDIEVCLNYSYLLSCKTTVLGTGARVYKRLIVVLAC